MNTKTPNFLNIKIFFYYVILQSIAITGNPVFASTSEAQKDAVQRAQIQLLQEEILVAKAQIAELTTMLEATNGNLNVVKENVAEISDGMNEQLGELEEKILANLPDPTLNWGAVEKKRVSSFNSSYELPGGSVVVGQKSFHGCLEYSRMATDHTGSRMANDHPGPECQRYGTIYQILYRSPSITK